ncbi:hypothetical protein BD410DRAFT_8081 [Rickenella mellea]|uniref:NAD(P)-binding protein n=1 Tax=Rickenella mellea TaxID=50990 RepID=A0A4R5XG98_9AGAM|nr:hypothetical protein BD410DRAFT_8081 [Rickenella mellea]
MTPSYRPRPVIIVTGANAGVGFGICHRLLLNLSRSHPEDALPQAGITSHFPPQPSEQFDDGPCDGLTLIMACRRVKIAETARTKLLKLLDADIARQKRTKSYDGHAEVFRKNLRIDIQYIDLAVVRSIMDFGETIRVGYPYVSHLICNAGVASFCGINYLQATVQMLKEPIRAVTTPEYNIQRVGEMSVDGLGWVWQCNIFGNYVLYRILQPQLNAYFTSTSQKARVIWMSSLEAISKFYDPADRQLIKSAHSYECSKFQLDLLVGHLEQMKPDVAVKHLLMHPGVVVTNISFLPIGWWMVLPMYLAFWLAKLLGSPNHPLKAYKSAITPVHLSIAHLKLLAPSIADSQQNGNGNLDQSPRSPPKFGSQTTYWGRPIVGVADVEDWETYHAEGGRIADDCERLYETFLKSEGAEPQIETASQHY